MHIGINLPQTEIGDDPATLLAFTRAAEEAGFAYLQVFDHVLGADSTVRPGWAGAYDHEDQFHEPFVLFGWLAAQTRMDLVTAVIVLPQRQTVLVAKQAAEVDLLTGGRLRLGVGVGWNEVEYEALGMNFHDRGARYEEQIDVLRRLWTEDIVDYKGRFHTIDRAGLLPRSVQRPIPIWMGSRAGAKVLRRVGRLGDGWIANLALGKGFEEALELVRAGAREAGRDPAAVGVQTTIEAGAVVDLDDLRRRRDAYGVLGVTHVTVTTARAGRSPRQHVDVMAELGALTR